MEKLILPIIAIVIGLILAFSGYRVQKILIILACFGFGFTIGGELLKTVITDHQILILVEALIGFICALIGLKIEKLAVFLGVAYLVYLAIGAYLPAIDNEIIRIVIEAAIALIVGAVAVMFLKPIIIIASGIYGAGLVQQYLPQVITNLPVITITIITIVIGISGIIFQFKNN